jgi:nucleotide-binding universal stress UspA family protein
MSVLVAVPDSPEGTAALAAAVVEAEILKTDLIIVNLSLRTLDLSALPDGIEHTVVERSGKPDRDPADAVLEEIRARAASRLVIGLKRRTPVGKAVLGSISQRLLVNSPVPVLAVKTSEDEDSAPSSHVRGEDIY